MSLTKAHNRMISDAAINVKDYGATGDGTTADTVAIISAMSAASSAEKTLFFPAGTYACGQINIPSNIRIVGEPGSIIKRTGNYGWTFAVFETPCDNVHIENLDFDNNAPGTSGTHKRSIFMRNATNITIKGCKFYNGYDESIKNLGPDGIYIQSLSPLTRNNILIEDCEITGFTRNGISVTDGVNGITISRCRFSENGLKGIDFEANVGSSTQVFDAQILNCDFINNGDEDIANWTSEIGGGLAIFSASPTTYHSVGVVIDGCYFKTTTARASNGIDYLKVNSAQNLTVTNCVFDEPDGTGAGTASTHRVVIEEGTFNSSGVNIDSNQFRNCPLITFSCFNQKISNNTFQGKRTYLQSSALGDNRVITGNTFAACGEAGVVDYIVQNRTPQAIITNNTFYDNRDSGLPDAVIEVATDIVIDNIIIISDNIVASDGTDTFGEFFRYSGGTGSDRKTNVKISNNFITGCDKPIFFEGGGSAPNAIRLSITNNQIQGATGGHGIKVFRGENMTITGNHLTDCGLTSYIRLDSCSKYLCTNNHMVDTRSSTSRTNLGVEAFNSPDSGKSLIANNLNVNTISGHSIAGTEGTLDNNIDA